jgi:hypothetical protein
MAKRKRSRNAWFGSFRKHRKHRRNAGGRGLVGGLFASAKSGFKASEIKTAAAVAGGNIGTQVITDHLLPLIPIASQYPIFNPILSGVVAGILAGTSKMVLKGHAKDILTGGMLVALTRTLKIIAPGTFGTLSMGDDLEGLALGPAYPGEGGMTGMSDYAMPWTFQNRMIPGTTAQPYHQGMIPAYPSHGVHGMGDYANLGQSGQRPTHTGHMIGGHSVAHHQAHQAHSAHHANAAHMAEIESEFIRAAM